MHTLTKLLNKGVQVFQDKMSMIKLLVSNERYGSISRAYFIALENKIVFVELQHWMIENNPPNEVQEIMGTDHMLIFSKPLELCSNLLKVAMKYS